MEKDSGVEEALQTVNSTFEEFCTFYSQLVEKGIEETEYVKPFTEVKEKFKVFYIKAKSNHEALMLNQNQFNEGRIGKDEYERALSRISQFLIEAKFNIGTEILPLLKRAEKRLLQEEIVQKVENIDLPNHMKEEVRQGAKEITAAMENAQKKDNVEQVKEYVNIGTKIMSLGEKLWAFTKKAAPIVAPIITRLFVPI